MRGRFTGMHDLEWCDRRLLARIHRLTLEGLRRQIAPVSTEQFMRFLVRYQHLQPETKLRGQAGLLALIEQLEGFEAPAGHWEKHILPARLESYDPSWLDTLTFMGQVAWGRLRPAAWMQQAGEANGRPMKALTRSTPITLMLRDHASWLLPSPEQLPESSVLDLARKQCPRGLRSVHSSWGIVPRSTRHAPRPRALTGGRCAGRTGRRRAGDQRRLSRLANVARLANADQATSHAGGRCIRCRRRPGAGRCCVPRYSPLWRTRSESRTGAGSSCGVTASCSEN